MAGNQVVERKITAENVAERAGVSRATVSRAFDPRSKISDLKRREILTIANEIGYRPTPVGRLVSREDRGIIVFITRDITNPVRANVLSNLAREVENARFLPLVFQAPDAKSATEKLATVFEYLPKAIVLSGFLPSGSMVTQCMQHAVPILVINRGRVEGLAASYVTSDHRLGGALAVEQLLRRGATALSLITGRNETDASDERARGFLEALARAGLSACSVVEGDHSYESGFKAAEIILGSPRPADGVFCSNDMTALGVMDAVRFKHKLSVPEDIQIIGYDNIEMSSWGAYRLSTVSQNVRTIIDRSMAAIEAIVQAPDTPFHEVIGVNFIARSTTKQLV